MNSWIIAGTILGAGIFICLILILRSNWKSGRKNIDDYKKGRDKLTFREKKKEKDSITLISDSRLSNIDLGNIIGGFIVLLIGLTLLPTVSTEINAACQDINVSSTLLICEGGEPSGTFGLFTIFFAAAIAITAITMVSRSLRDAGVL